MNRNKASTKALKRLVPVALISFSLTLFLCSTLIGITILSRSNVEKLEMEQLINDKSVRIAEVISRLLYKTEALSALVIQGNGEIENFEKVAATIIDDPAILNVLIAPGGVVSDVYPLVGNEAVIGLDFLSEGEGNKEAILAKKRGELVFGGPFNLVQGGQALVGRLPVYMNLPAGGKKFWGLVSVTLKYPDALHNVGIDSLEEQGYVYEIWRISPDTGEHQIIAQSSKSQGGNLRFIEKEIPLLNANWYFRVASLQYWYHYTETWILIFCSLLISLLVMFVMQNNYELRLIQTELEYVAQMDPLTGIFNKRHFMESALTHLERSRRLGSKCFIIMMDLDFFKKVNDTYGHVVGDELLKEFSRRVENIIRPYDLFARFGGEEFIILVSDANDADSINLAERIRIVVSENTFEFDNASIKITSSFGVAQMLPEDDLIEVIKLADQALYRAKAEGRNRVVFYE